MVYYRKYRPQTLNEVIGQELVKQSLKSAIASGKLSHAYLFCGPRGTGKTSTARILAKIVNCEDPKGAPCNKCVFCQSITDGSNLDVVEIDAASNRGIDDVRALRENIKLSPTSARRKVYIIDEVHMLSTDAFNALLKTLEEPPEHVLFILATTEVQKIPQTILSRVQRLDFKPATISELVSALDNVAQAEKLKIDKDLLPLIAKSAQGSFRDGIKLLDLLSGFQVIDRKVVEETLGGGVFDGICQILAAVADKDCAKALKSLTDEIKSGVNIKELNLSIIDILRQLLFIKHNLGESLVKPEVLSDRLTRLEELAARFDHAQLISAIDCFVTSLEQGRFVSIPTLPLELAVVESCRSAESVNQSVSVSVDQPVSKSENSGKSEKSASQQVSKSDSETPIHRDAETLIQRSADTPISSDPDIRKIQEKWTYILETVRAYNFSLEALLRSAHLASCEGNSVLFEVPYSFHQRILEAPKSKDLLESILADILGRVVYISTTLGTRPVKNEELANIEIAADDDIIRLASEIFSSETIN